MLSSEQLAATVDQVLASLPGKVAEYRAGKTSLLGMFTGQVIKATGGKANPQASGILKELLSLLDLTRELPAASITTKLALSARSPLATRYFPISRSLRWTPMPIILLLFGLALLISALGFIRVVYFVSIGYAFSIVANGDRSGFPAARKRHMGFGVAESAVGDVGYPAGMVFGAARTAAVLSG